MDFISLDFNWNVSRTVLCLLSDVQEHHTCSVDTLADNILVLFEQKQCQTSIGWISLLRKHISMAL